MKNTIKQLIEKHVVAIIIIAIAIPLILIFIACYYVTVNNYTQATNTFAIFEIIFAFELFATFVLSEIL